MGSREPNIKVSICDKMASLKVLLIAFISVAAGQSNFRCPEKDGYFEDPNQCDKYYDCFDGIAEERLCPDGLVFDPFSRKREPCDHYFNHQRVQVICAPVSMDSTLTPTQASATSSMHVSTEQPKNTLAPQAFGSMNTAAFATGPKPLTERTAKPIPMLWRHPMVSSAPSLPPQTSSVSSILIPSMLTPTTAPSSSSV